MATVRVYAGAVFLRVARGGGLLPRARGADALSEPANVSVLAHTAHSHTQHVQVAVQAQVGLHVSILTGAGPVRETPGEKAVGGSRKHPHLPTFLPPPPMLSSHSKMTSAGGPGKPPCAPLSPTPWDLLAAAWPQSL